MVPAIQKLHNKKENSTIYDCEDKKNFFKENGWITDY